MRVGLHATSSAWDCNAHVVVGPLISCRCRRCDRRREDGWDHTGVSVIGLSLCACGHARPSKGDCLTNPRLLLSMGLLGSRDEKAHCGPTMWGLVWTRVLQMVRQWACRVLQNDLSSNTAGCCGRETRRTFATEAKPALSCKLIVSILLKWRIHSASLTG